MRAGGHRKRDISDLARVNVEAFGQRVEVLAIFALAVLPASGFLKEYCCQLFVSCGKDLVLDHPASFAPVRSTRVILRLPTASLAFAPCV